MSEVRTASPSIEAIRWKHSLRDLSVIGFALTLSVLVLGAGLGWFNIARLARNERQVAHTYEVMSQLEAVLSTLTDAETGQRGYLLTEDERYLQTYEAGRSRVDATIAQLEGLISDTPDQRARLGVLEQRIAAKLDELRRTVALMKAGHRSNALDIVRRNEGKALMDNVRQDVAAMQQAEDELLRRRAEESNATFLTTVSVILLSALIGIVSISLVFYLSRRNLKARQRAAEVLAEQHERLRVTLASIGDAVLTTDAEGRITFLNAVAESVTGWKLEEAAGRPVDTVFRIVNEQTRQPAPNPVVRALREGVIVGLANHTILIRKDGTELPIDDSAAPMLGVARNLAGCVLVFRDITVRRRGEEALRESESRLNGIIASATDAIISLDADQKIVVFNAGASTIFGYSADEMLGQRLDRLIPERFRTAHREHVEGFGKAGVSLRAMGGERVLTGVRRNGEEFPIEARISQITVGKQKIYTVILRDVTERQQAEAERVARIEAERRGREIAEASNRAKDEFLAMLGHELRNPLSAVRNAVATASLDDSLRPRALEIARRQSEQLGRLIDDLLDVARITQGRITLRKERVELNEILQRAVESNRPFIESRGLHLRIALAPERIRLDADPARLEQVLANLLSNAAKYTEAGGRIDLIVERRDQEAVIHIRDTGMGIAADMLPRIWEPFAQADRALDRAQGGLGIGLTVARRLVELHGGRIEAYSEGLGKGAEFVVTIPALPVTSEEIQSPVAPEPVPQRAARVLLVEDNPDAAESLTMLLELLGHRVRTVCDGLAAIDAARANIPDVMLIDIGLPGMDGYEVARRVRRNPDLERVVLVALTGYGREEDQQRAMAAGFDYHLVKPVNPDALHNLVSRLADEPTIH